jgi:hypothetical protein
MNAMARAIAQRQYQRPDFVGASRGEQLQQLDHYSGVDTAPAVATNAHTGACDNYIVRVPHLVLIELARIALGSLREAGSTAGAGDSSVSRIRRRGVSCADASGRLKPMRDHQTVTQVM